MTTGGFGMGQPEISPVAGIELAGREFMQGVFGSGARRKRRGPEPGSQQGLCRPRPSAQEPDDERLRTQFAEMGYNKLVLMLASGERQYAFMQSNRGIEDQYHVKWQRPPHNERRM